MPISKVIHKLLNEDLGDNIMNEDSAECSEYVRKTKSFKKTPASLILFFDDFTVKKNKIFAIYCGLDNGRQIEDPKKIPAVLFAPRKIIENNNLSEILSPLIKELQNVRDRTERAFVISVFS